MKNQNQLKALLLIKRLTSIGLVFGFILFLSNFLVSDTMGEYHLFIGLSIMVSSMLLFGFGMFISLMAEVSHSGKQTNPSPRIPRLYLVKK